MAGFDDFGDADMLFMPKPAPNKFQVGKKQEKLASTASKPKQERQGSKARLPEVPLDLTFQKARDAGENNKGVNGAVDQVQFRISELKREP